jgi:hypothetical protein
MSLPSNARIDWSAEGPEDRLMGTGATRAERALAYAGGALAIPLIAYLVLSRAVAWRWWQVIVALLIAGDVLAGAVANSLNSCKRYYHTPAAPSDSTITRRAKNHYLFAALHVYPLLVAALFGPGAWAYGAIWYALLLLASAAVLQAPLYLRRPAALLAIVACLLLNQYAIPPVAGFEWLMPALFLKIVLGHLVREEPYRPAPPASYPRG